MIKKSRQKSKYLENENSFWRTFIEANKTNFLVGGSPTLISINKADFVGSD